MARSGYEIRLDVLRLAKDLADDRFNVELGKRIDAAGRNNNDYELPADNRETEALALADKFYDFVQQESSVSDWNETAC